MTQEPILCNVCGKAIDTNNKFSSVESKLCGDCFMGDTWWMYCEECGTAYIITELKSVDEPGDMEGLWLCEHCIKKLGIKQYHDNYLK